MLFIIQKNNDENLLISEICPGGEGTEPAINRYSSDAWVPYIGEGPFSTVQVGTWPGSNDPNHVCVNHRSVSNGAAATWTGSQEALEHRPVMYCCDVWNYLAMNRGKSDYAELF